MIRKNDYPYSHYSRTENAVQGRGPDEEILRGIFFLGIVSIFFICAYHLLTHCAYFRIDRIAVSGNERISRKEILAYAGIRKGVNLLSLNLFLSQKRLRTNPWIARCRIVPLFPRNVRIEITEHRPLAVFDMGESFIVNQQGRIFKRAEKGETDSLPRVSGLKFSDISDTAEAETAAPFRAVMEVLLSGQTEDSILPNPQIREIRLDRETGISLLLSQNYRPCAVEEIRLGYHHFPRKYKKLRKLFAYMKKHSDMHKIRSIDLNHPDRIAVNPGRTEVPAGKNKEV